MGRRRLRLGWRYDAKREEFHTPSGIVTLCDLAKRMQNDATCHFTLTGPWTGWKIHQQHLKGPGGVRLTPQTARAYWRWVNSADGLRRETPRASHRTMVCVGQLYVLGPVLLDHRAANTPLRNGQGT